MKNTYKYVIICTYGGVKMITKLTLAIDDMVIKRAKRYAQKRNLSLSKIVEFYFASLTAENRDGDATLPPITAKSSGMVKIKKIFKEDDVLADALLEKYL